MLNSWTEFCWWAAMQIVSDSLFTNSWPQSTSWLFSNFQSCWQASKQASKTTTKTHLSLNLVCGNLDTNVSGVLLTVCCRLAGRSRRWPGRRTPNSKPQFQTSFLKGTRRITRLWPIVTCILGSVSGSRSPFVLLVFCPYLYNDYGIVRNFRDTVVPPVIPSVKGPPICLNVLCRVRCLAISLAGS